MTPAPGKVTYSSPWAPWPPKPATRVRYTLASKLVNELVEAADDKQLTKLITRYGRVDLLLVDELGYLQLDRRGAELLFQVLTEREERSAIAIASNEPFSSWTKTFTDPRLCAAIVDRLTFAGQIIETGSHLLPTRPRPKRETPQDDRGQIKPSSRGQIKLTFARCVQTFRRATRPTVRSADLASRNPLVAGSSPARPTTSLYYLG